MGEKWGHTFLLAIVLVNSEKPFFFLFFFPALDLRKNNQNKFLGVEQENGGIISLQTDAVLPENTIKNNLLG